MKGKPLLAYFTASWCEPCQEMEPNIYHMAMSYKEVLDVAMIDVDKQKPFVTEMGVGEVPSYLLVQGNEVIDRAIGYMPLEALEEFVERNLSKK